MRLKYHLAACMVILTLVLASCETEPITVTNTTQPTLIISPNASSTTVPPSTLSATPISPTQAPDEIVNTPGGWAYRDGNSLQWTEVTIGDTANSANVMYRNDITTNPGQTRNIIFSIGLPNVKNPQGPAIHATIGAINLPSGMIFSEDPNEYNDGAPAVRCDKIVHIQIDASVKPGQYNFQFTVSIDGKNYGQVPSTIRVFPFGATQTVTLTGPPTVEIQGIGGGSTGNWMVYVRVTNFNLVNKIGQPNVEWEGHLNYFLDVDAPIAQGIPAITIPCTCASTVDDTYTWQNITPAKHTFSVELVNNDNTPLDPPVVAKQTFDLSLPTSNRTL